MSEASGFIRFKSRWTMRWALLNMRRVHHLPHSIRQGEQPFAGRTVVVAGAGPSLDRNGYALREAVDKSIPIVTVNAGDCALRSMGIRPDVVVARESLDLTDQAEATEARSWVLDISSHPGQWTAIERHSGVTGYWFLPLYPRHVPLSRMLGVRPIPAGSSALCSAVSHAIQWGARRIILAGVDLAVAEDGSVYHPGAPRGALRASVDGDTLILEGDEQDAERARRSGQRPQGSQIDCIPVVSSDWTGVRPAKTVFENQRQWLEEVAAPHRHGATIDCVNASERGAGVVGWRSERLAEVLRHEHPQRPVELPEGQHVPESVVEDTVRRHIRDAEILRHQCEELLEPGGPNIRAQPIHLHTPGQPPAPTMEGSALVEALAAHAIVDVPSSTPADERVEIQARAWLAAAEEALEVLTCGRSEEAA